ncbi:hypothetical protein CRM22_006394 [Opisthorchis felineus]|uniref:Uncharacterized protein n=1 Tax=Opisthorchis felineus TaxID=147828 RepID=A0A4S2LMX8_OPIFE|nr:hypothetical protein CRM22_006394 [Opisthorchis felineus]
MYDLSEINLRPARHSLYRSFVAFRSSVDLMRLQSEKYPHGQKFLTPEMSSVIRAKLTLELQPTESYFIFIALEPSLKALARNLVYPPIHPDSILFRSISSVSCRNCSRELQQFRSSQYRSHASSSNRVNNALHLRVLLAVISGKTR